MDEQPLHDPQAPAETFDDPGPEPRPNGNIVTWVIDLYFRPGRALAGRVLTMPRPSLFVLTWMMGIAGAISQFSLRMQLGTGSAVKLDWFAIWAIAIIGGLLGGLMRLLVLGAWYHCRVWLSGGRGFTWSQSRRVYASASLVWVLPELLSWVIYTVVYDTPQQAADDTLWVIVLPGMFVPFLAVWTGYRGARAALGARRGPAMFWLLGLPVAFLLLVTAGLVALASNTAATPDTDNPASFANPALHFDYPGNWRTDTDEDAWTRSWSVEIADPDDTVYTSVSMYYHELTAAERLDEILADVRNAGWSVQSQRPLARWGRHAGAGAEFTASRPDGQFQVRVLAFEIEPGVLGDIYAWSSAAKADSLRPGLDLLAETLRFVPLAQQSADLASVSTWHNRFFEVEVPGNWHREPAPEEDGWGPGLDSTSPQGSWQSIDCYATEASPMEEILESVKFLAADVEEFQILDSPRTFGRYPCVGQIVTGRTDDGPFRASVYAIPITGGRVIEIINYVEDAHRPLVEPGFNHLEQTFRLADAIEIDEALLLPGAPSENRRPNPKPDF